MRKFRNVLRIIAAAFILTLPLSACSNSAGAPIHIVHKNYTEQRIVGQVLSLYLEANGYDTKLSELGGTALCFNALKSDQADLYAEYTGTAYSFLLKQTDILSPDETYDYVKSNFEKDYGITWLADMGFNDTYTLSVTTETAEKYNLNTISDLIRLSPQLTLACDLEFEERADGLPGLLSTYPGLSFVSVKSMDEGLTYQALANGDVNVGVSYSTDGRLLKFGLVNLKDDKQFFPPYYCTPILKMDFAEKNPEVVDLLNALDGRWSEEEMQKYSLMADEGTPIKEVATLMLRDKSLLN